LRAAKIRICVAKKEKISVSELIGNKNLLQKIELNSYCTDSIGLPSLKDIV
jgi:uncharacterized protein